MRPWERRTADGLARTSSRYSANVPSHRSFSSSDRYCERRSNKLIAPPLFLTDLPGLSAGGLTAPAPTSEKTTSGRSRVLTWTPARRSLPIGPPLSFRVPWLLVCRKPDPSPLHVEAASSATSTYS